MPKPSQSGRKRFFYNQNIKRVKSHAKYKNLIDHTITLVKRLEKEGMTTWIADALNKAQSKIKAYGINFVQFANALEHKGLSSLTTLTQDTLIFVQKKGNNVAIKKIKATVTTPSKILVGDVPAKKTPAKKIEKGEVEKKVVEKKAPAKKEAIKKETPVKKAAVKKTPAKKPTKKEA